LPFLSIKGKISAGMSYSVREIKKIYLYLAYRIIFKKHLDEEKVNLHREDRKTRTLMARS